MILFCLVYKKKFDLDTPLFSWLHNKYEAHYFLIVKLIPRIMYFAAARYLFAAKQN